MQSEVSEERWMEVLAKATERCREDVYEAKQDRSRRRKRDLLHAACRIFARDGIARAKMADIAAEAGIPVSSVYDYYPSKEELAYEIPMERFAAFFAEFSERSKALGTARERVASFLLLTADFARRNPDWARLLYLEVWPSVLLKAARVRRTIDDYARILIEMIREGGRRGEWDPKLDAYGAASIMMGSVNQVIITWLLYRKPDNLTQATKPLVDRLMRLLEMDTPASAGARSAVVPRIARNPRRKRSA